MQCQGPRNALFGEDRKCQKDPEKKYMGVELDNCFLKIHILTYLSSFPMKIKNFNGEVG